MASLIKSSRVLDEPVVLRRPELDNALPMSEAAPIETPAPAVEAVVYAEPSPHVALETYETAEVSPPVPEQITISYEEYRQRFEVELNALEEDARERGFERGKREALEQVQAEYESRLGALTDLISTLRASLDQSIDGLADVGMEVVCEAVAKIVGEAAVSKDAVVSIVRNVIRRAKDRTKLVVRVSRADWALLEGHEAELIDGLSVGSVEIIADDRVKAGGCLLETPAGNLDGRLEVQLERLHDAMLAARAAERETESAA